MNPRLATAALAAALALTVTPPSFAQQPAAPNQEARPMQPHPGHGMHSGHHAQSGRQGDDGLMMPGAGMLRGLNLSDAQRDRVFSILHAQAPQLRTHMREARQARQALQQLALAGDLDEARLQEAAQRASRASADLAVLRARTQNALYKELTPEQQAQLKARMEHRGHRGGHPRADVSEVPHAG
jgi:Spy/CpxP family protein refolding chaperone